MIENIVIGKILIHPSLLFAKDENDWNNNIKQTVLFTEERFLPRIMVDLGIVKSVSEVKRNQPKLCRELRDIDFIEIKWGKKFLWIAVGE